MKQSLLDALKYMCEDAFWTVHVFFNPFYSDGAEVEDKSMVSINPILRNPRYDNLGNPIKTRRKNQAGRAIGEPVPIEPLHNLKIENEGLMVELVLPSIV